jgi:hypothetical protein
MGILLSSFVMVPKGIYRDTKYQLSVGKQHKKNFPDKIMAATGAPHIDW